MKSPKINNSILTGPVGKTILKMSLPMMVGLVGVVSLNLIDAYFIGK
jgi:Na+-driven multidrug efflux pump